MEDLLKFFIGLITFKNVLNIALMANCNGRSALKGAEGISSNDFICLHRGKYLKIWFNGRNYKKKKNTL